MSRQSNQCGAKKKACGRRRGVVVVLTAAVLVLCFAFVSFSVDTALIVYTNTKMQNGVDAASLAASQEILLAVYQSAQTGQDPNTIAMEAARAVAVQVAADNDVYIDANQHVEFGNRAYNKVSGQWEISWGSAPYNVVKVTGHRDNANPDAADAKLPLFFGWAVGRETVDIRVSSTAFISARDMVLVMDFSGSMNDDSTYVAFSKLGKANVEANMADIFTALGANTGTMPVTPTWLKVTGAAPSDASKPQLYVTFQRDATAKDQVFVESTLNLENVVLQFTDGTKQTFSGLTGLTGTFQGTGSYNGKKISKCWVKSGNNLSGEGTNYGERFDDTNANVMKQFGLNAIAYPYPSGSWDAFINYCRNDSSVNTAGYRKKYGGLNFVNYLETQQPQNYKTPDLWKTPHYPFHAIKEGATLFCEHLGTIGFGDEIGLVSYDDYSRVETTLSTDGYSIDISANPITDEYDSINQMQRHKQAAHYYNYTAIGYGVRDAHTLLTDHIRGGASPTIILLTDGLANRKPSGWSLPGGWNWAEYTDYDGDGDSDFSTTDTNVQYAFYEAALAAQDGITIHTISVGIDGDDALMQAIAFVGNGIMVDVPATGTVEDTEQQLKDAFKIIASKLPPPKLIKQTFE